LGKVKNRLTFFKDEIV